MSLCEITIAQKEHQPFTSCESAIAAKRAARNDLEKDVAEVLKNGGKISGASADFAETQIAKQMREKRKKAALKNRKIN